MRPGFLLAIPFALGASTVADAQLCDGTSAAIAADGRVLGHFAYGDAPASDLASAPPGFALGQPCMVQRDMVPDLERLIADAQADPATGGQLRGLSCHRGLTHQGAVFCRERPAGGAHARAISAAPPGHSEHSTGYAIDFAVRPSPNCPDTEACMAASRPARWLIANAARFGFEMSFPAGNRQQVKWEPWHWRWVGMTEGAPGAARARARFAHARAAFPASPGLPDTPVVRVMPPPPVAVALPPFPAKRKRRSR